MPCSDRHLHVQKTFLSGMLERTKAAGVAEQDSAPGGRRAGPQTCRNWAIASCCIIKYVIAEQSWEGGLCRQRCDFSPCEVPCCAQHPAWPVMGHTKILGSFFLLCFLLCHMSCSPQQEQEEGGWVSSPWGTATQHRLSCEPCEGGALCQGGASPAEGTQGTTLVCLQRPRQGRQEWTRTGLGARWAVQDGARTTLCARHGLSVGLAHSGLPTKFQHGSGLGYRAARGEWLGPVL